MMLFQAVVDIKGNLEQQPGIIFDLGTFIEGLARTALIMAGVACFGYMVYGGVQWTLSGGDKGKVEAAQKSITNAIIGLGITATSFAVFAVIQYLFGVDIVKF